MELFENEFDMQIRLLTIEFDSVLCCESCSAEHHARRTQLAILQSLL